MPRRLNGWQRLWIVVAALWLIVVISFLVAGVPKGSDHQETRVSASMDAAGHYLERTKPGFIYRGAWSSRHERHGALSDEELLSRLHKTYEGKVDFSAIETEYQRKMDHLPQEWLKAAGVAFLVWFVPAGLVYVLGVALAWILQGFRQPR